MRFTILALVASFLIGGCAAPARKEDPAYTVPSAAQTMNEVANVQRRVATLEAKAPASLRSEVEQLKANLQRVNEQLGAYIKQVETMTAQLNEAIKEKNDALARVQYLEEKRAKALEQLWMWRIAFLVAAGFVIAYVAIKTGWKFAL